MLTTIVVPVDDGTLCERALPVAAALARATGAAIELVTVESIGIEPASTADRLGRLAASVEGVPVTTTVLPTNSTVVEALAGVDREPGTVVCMAPHARHPLAALVAGSVAEGLVRRATLPILLVGPACAAPGATGGPVVTAVDGSERDASAIATAIGFARATGATVEILHVVTRPSAPEAWARADEILAGAEAAVRDAGVSVTTSLVASTDPEVGVLRALGTGAACVVVGSHRRPAVGRLVLGSTGTALARRAPCPVLVAANAAVASVPG